MRLFGFVPALVVLSSIAACSSSEDSGGSSPSTAGTSTTTGASSNGKLFGDPHDGIYNLGPVDWAETQWHNSCSPYDSSIPSIYGNYLAGLELTFNGNGQLCDSCIQITTKKGKSLVARVVTTGVTNHKEDIDLSPEAYDALFSGEEPRLMTWQLVSCAESGTLRYQFQTGAHVDWSSFWVRNPRIPISKVEVKSSRHDFRELRRETDGTLNDDSGFGPGEFTIRLTGMNGQVVTDTFAGFSPGELLVGKAQF